MSYGLSNNQCYNCEKKGDCKDAQKIQEGINKLHQDNEGHLGSGQIILQCVKMVTTIKETPRNA